MHGVYRVSTWDVDLRGVGELPRRTRGGAWWAWRATRTSWCDCVLRCNCRLVTGVVVSVTPPSTPGHVSSSTLWTASDAWYLMGVKQMGGVGGASGHR